MTWGWVGTRGTWDTAEAAASMTRHGRPRRHLDRARLRGRAGDAVQSTEIPFRDEPTVTDDEIVWAIREAHGAAA